MESPVDGSQNWTIHFNALRAKVCSAPVKARRARSASSSSRSKDSHALPVVFQPLTDIERIAERLFRGGKWTHSPSRLCPKR